MDKFNSKLNFNWFQYVDIKIYGVLKVPNILRTFAGTKKETFILLHCLIVKCIVCYIDISLKLATSILNNSPFLSFVVVLFKRMLLSLIENGNIFHITSFIVFSFFFFYSQIAVLTDCVGKQQTIIMLITAKVHQLR